MTPVIEIVDTKPARVLIYEYGLTIDRECEKLIGDQVVQARRLYNEIIAEMQSVVRQVDEIVFANLDAQGRQLLEEVSSLTAQFDAARAEKREEDLKIVAQKRREVRRQLYPLMSQMRKQLRDQTKLFYAKVGKNSASTTYQIRCRYVDEGLGWGTANAVLDAGLIAWKKTMARGRAPKFAIGAEKQQDTLTLQFTLAGGLPSGKILSGDHGELKLISPAGYGKHGEFSFRLGAASAGQYATGQYAVHRPLPDDVHVGLARLVRRQHAERFDYALQLMVKLPEPIYVQTPKDRQRLAVVHFGWAADSAGRRVAGVASDADPGGASLLRLSPKVELLLEQSASIKSERDIKRNAIVAAVKSFEFPAGAELPERLAENIAALKRTKPEHVPQRRLYGISYQLSDLGIEVPGLTLWRKEDRKRGQQMFNVSRRAYAERAEQWRQVASDLVQNYEAIAFEPLDLAAAAEKIDENTGERSEFNAAARRGRHNAGISLLVSQIKWACTKTHTPLMEISAETVSTCAYCLEGHPVPVERDGKPDHQTISCPNCGSVGDRKMMGAARAWQLVSPELERLHKEYRESVVLAAQEGDAKNKEKKLKMAEGRRKAREEREAREESESPEN